MLVVMVVVVVSAVVAVTATGVGLLLPPLDLNEGGVRAVRIAGGAAAFAGLVVLLVQRNRLRPPGGRGPDATVAGLLAAATLMGILTLIALLAPALPAGLDSGGPGIVATEGSTIDPDAPPPPSPLPPSRTAPVTEGAAPGDDREEPQWQIGGGGGGAGAVAGDGRSVRRILPQVANLLLLVLLLGAVIVGILALTGRRGGRRPEPTPDDSPGPVADAEAGLEASLDALDRSGGDPREQITAAYGHLMAALARAGAPREPYEAPHEHLRRALGPLGVRAEPMHRLTGLYVAAQFSDRPITERHRAAAVDALEVSLASLRSIHGPEGAEDGAPARQPVPA